MTEPVQNDEAAAVRSRYARRGSRPGDARYSMLNPAALLTLQERQRLLSKVLEREAIVPAETRLLEVGCGAGGNLLDFLRMGFAPEHLIGLELLPERIEAARRVLPSAVSLHAGDALTIPIPPGSQDIVFQAVVFSSLLSDDFQQRLAAEMWEWVAPGGAVLWYDFVYDNPANADVRGVPMRRVRELFPEGNVIASRVTLAPPIARRVTRVHPALYGAFNMIPLLRTHVLCWIQKP